MGGYDYFTRKQANILYGAIKRGELYADKGTIKDMYDIVDRRSYSLSLSDRIFRGHLERALDHYLNKRPEYAQEELNGNIVRLEHVKIGTETREATEDDWFYEPGELIEDDIYEDRWVVDKKS